MLCVLLAGMLPCFALLRPKLTVQSQTLNAKVCAKRPILNTPKERHNHLNALPFNTSKPELGNPESQATNSKNLNPKPYIRLCPVPRRCLV